MTRTVKIALGLALLLAPLAGRGQGSSWNWLTGNNLRSVKFLKGTNEGWTVGQRGLILHTTDGGDHWEVQNSNTDQDLWGIFFLDQNNGWVTGGYKTCLRTRDGGRNWQVVHTEPSGFRHFKGVCFLDTMVGWVAGTVDSIGKTTDGGTSWIMQPTNTTGYVWYDITFTDTLHGWRVALNGLIGRTTDGGFSWRDTSVGLSEIYDVDFNDSLRGLVVGYATVGRTSDGGTTWVLNNPVNQYLYGLSIADTLQSYACGGHNGNLAVLLRTTNGGTSWSAQNMTNDHALFGVSAPETIKAFTVGESGSILKTTNGGLAWQILRNLDAQNETMFNIALADTQSGYAVGPYGIVVKTTNGGTIWQSQNLGGTSLWFYGVDSPDPNYAWACGDLGRIYATKDGGTSWASQNTGVSWFLESVDMVDTLFGVAVGGGYGKIANFGFRISNSTTKSEIASSARLTRGTPRNDTTLKPSESPPLVGKWWWIKEGQNSSKAQYRVITRTFDGTNWQGNTTNETPLIGVSFVNKAEGWAVGVSGTVIHTTDSGATWQAQTTNVTDTLYWVIFPTPLNGWAVGTGGTIIATTDGGITWLRQTSNTTLGLLSAAFVDAQRGWVVGDSGIALQTTDGGASWFFDTTQTKILLYATNFTDQDHGWSIGGFGLTLGYGRAGQWGVEEQGSKGAGELRVNNGIKAWPNPFVSYARMPGREKDKFALYDITGRKIGTYPGNQIGMDAPAGVYFLMAESKESRPTRIVKIR